MLDVAVVSRAFQPAKDAWHSARSCSLAWLTYAWLPLVEGVGIIQPPPEALQFSWIAFIPPRILFPADASTF